MEIKFTIIIILLYTYFFFFLEFYPLFTFHFQISSVCRCFRYFTPPPPNLPIDEAGCLPILYHIPDMPEEPGVNNTTFRATLPQTQHGGRVKDRERESMFCTRSCVHMQRKREKYNVVRGLA